MKTIKIFIALFILAITSNQVKAQIVSVKLKANGLTCSMCSNSVEKSLRTIDYVADIKADLETTSFEITFKENAKISLDDLKNKVEAAGFSVGALWVNMKFSETKIDKDTHVTLGSNLYHFLDAGAQTLNGDKQIRVVDKGFVSKKEYKEFSKKTKMKCIKTGYTGSCCEGGEGKRIYHVVL